VALRQALSLARVVIIQRRRFVWRRGIGFGFVVVYESEEAYIERPRLAISKSLHRESDRDLLHESPWPHWGAAQPA
jgi:hypothetical protein